MARTAGSWTILAGLGLAALLQWGCQDPERPEAVPGASEALNTAKNEVIVPRIEAFRVAAAALEVAVSAWADSGSPADKDAAKVAWIEAMTIWQQIEAMQVGPTASSLVDPAGADFADEIYSWPETNPCRVDQEVVAENYAQPTFFDDVLVNATGLDAMEQLLFAGADNACPNQIPINSEGTWDALGADGVDANRADYALALAQQVLVDTDGLLDAWSTFAIDQASYGSEQDALNAVYDAVFFLETGLKDRKLAEPLGARTCTSDCLGLVESRGQSGQSTRWILNNLIGGRDLFTGGGGVGLDDLLVNAGRQDLSEAVTVAIDTAIDTARSIQIPVDVLATDDPDDAAELLAQCAAVGALLKGEVATVLSLQVPAEAAGDND